MRTYDLGEVISARQLQLVTEDGGTYPCSVEIGKPVKVADEEWICPYRVSTSEKDKVFGMHGIDSMQAVILSLRTLDGEIAAMAKRFNAIPRFLDGSHETIYSP